MRAPVVLMWVVACSAKDPHGHPNPSPSDTADTPTLTTGSGTVPSGSTTPGSESCTNGVDDDLDAAVDCDDDDCAAFPLCPTDGSAWVHLTATGPLAGTVAKAMILDGQGRLFASNVAGLWRSDDAGISWTSVGAVELLHKLEVSPTGVVFGGGNDTMTVWRSVDGASFDPIVFDDVCAMRVGTKVSGFAFPPSGDIVAGTGWIPVWRSTFRSTDGGLSWANEPQCAAGVNTVVVSIGSNAAGVVVTSTEGQGTWVSTDDGVTWAQSDMTLNQQGYDLLADASGDFFLAAQGFGYNGVWSAGPDGMTWTQRVAFPERPTRLDQGPGGELFVGTEMGSLWWSVDGGDTWESVPPPPRIGGATGFVFDVVVDDAGYLIVSVAAGDGGVFRSARPWRAP